MFLACVSDDYAISTLQIGLSFVAYYLFLEFDSLFVDVIVDFNVKSASGQELGGFVKKYSFDSGFLSFPKHIFIYYFIIIT